MIAKENKFRTKLGKRIKRLEIHQVLFEGYSPIEAAENSKGVDWETLDALCKNFGF